MTGPGAGGSPLARLSALAGASRFRRNFLAVAKANVVAQALLLASVPLLSRLYSPEAFGLAALFMAALQMLASFASWKYERIVPNSRSRRGAAARVAAGLLALGAVCTATALGIAFAPGALALWDGAGELGPLLWWLPLAVAAHGLQVLGASWFVRERELGPVSRARIMQSVGYLVVAFACAAFALARSGLVLATAAAWVASFLALAGALGPLVRALGALRPARALRVLRATLPEASRATAVGFLNTVSLTAPVVLLAEVYSAAELGLYALMMRVVGTPLTIVTASLSLSFWSRAAELVRERRFAALRRTFLKTTAYLAIPACAVVAVCLASPAVVPLVLGERWAAAGPVLVAATPMLVGTALFSATNHLVVLRRQGLQAVADGARLTLLVLVAAVARAEDLAFVWAVFWMACASLVGHVLLFLIQLRVHGRIEAGAAR